MAANGLQKGLICPEESGSEAAWADAGEALVVALLPLDRKKKKTNFIPLSLSPKTKQTKQPKQPKQNKTNQIKPNQTKPNKPKKNKNKSRRRCAT